MFRIKNITSRILREILHYSFSCPAINWPHVHGVSCVLPAMIDSRTTMSLNSVKTIGWMDGCFSSLHRVKAAHWSEQATVCWFLPVGAFVVTLPFLRYTCSSHWREWTKLRLSQSCCRRTVNSCWSLRYFIQCMKSCYLLPMISLRYVFPSK